MTTLGTFVGALALTGMTAGVAAADHQKVDGSISSGGDTCSWTNADTSANPPETLTVDHETVNANTTCSGSKTVTLNNDPTVTFDDEAGTATADLIDVTVVEYGVTCEYQAENVQAERDGTTRAYSAAGVTVYKSGGSFLCPSTETADAKFLFH
ncbi:hypothetical protein [Saccharomonospora saliphila]|uniref:hypothetical protein n=1 Tax=Saccharomonospora saliphila TaxID=369829 RepID=UPI00035CD301|nr:hypothetical protein [Saccharomonospora saliphila]